MNKEEWKITIETIIMIFSIIYLGCIGDIIGETKGYGYSLIMTIPMTLILITYLGKEWKQNKEVKKCRK